MTALGVVGGQVMCHMDRRTTLGPPDPTRPSLHAVTDDPVTGSPAPAVYDRLDPRIRRSQGAPIMKLFLDTAVIDEIRTAHGWGVLDGVTTNPTLFARAGGGSYPEVLAQICSITSGPVSAEVIASDLDGILEQGREYAKIAPNIIIKVPMTETGLTAISTFAEEGIQTNCTLIFSSAQGLLAAKAGATYLSPFVGRLDDIAQDGMDMVRELSAILEIQAIDAQIIVASARSPRHVIDGALAGAHVATVPFKVLQQMVHHPLTDKGIAQFEADWQKAQAELAAKG
jgi:transaldolase